MLWGRDGQLILGFRHGVAGFLTPYKTCFEVGRECFWVNLGELEAFKASELAAMGISRADFGYK